MYFRMLHDDASGAMSYLLADLGSGEAVLIDPRGADVPVLLAMLAEHHLQLRWVLRTHEHDALLPREERLAVSSLPAPQVLHRAPHDGHLCFGDEYVEVVATPGHTSRCLSFRWRDRVFCGGLLAVDECPHQPVPAAPQSLWDSVHERVFPLPDETLLFSGHARDCRAASTVYEQRRRHPWFAQASRDEFLARVAALPRALPEVAAGTQPAREPARLPR